MVADFSSIVNAESEPKSIDDPIEQHFFKLFGIDRNEGESLFPLQFYLGIVRTSGSRSQIP